MTLPPLNLDDRRFDDLLAEARRLIQSRCPSWTDLSAGDPGAVLLEAFAHLTEVMIYRLNRLPEKAYREFAQLLGVKPGAPSAAATQLEFTLAAALDRALEIPAGTRVSAARGSGDDPAPVYVVTQPLTLPAGTTSGKVRGIHCDLTEGELLGHGTGEAGLNFVVAQPPIIAPSGDRLDLVVAVEVPAGSDVGDNPAREFEGRQFRLWHEVEGFADLSADACAYSVDRAAGRITFAPALRSAATASGAGPGALAAVPAAGSEIRVWYRHGGGAQGNIGANTLTLLKDPVPGAALTVTNPEPGVGGEPMESIAETLARAPIELHSLRRAVTARDFQLIAERASGGISRAHAYTKATHWSHAKPGTIEVILVPELPVAQRSTRPLTPAILQAHESADALTQVQSELDLRKPLGTHCQTQWCRYKTIRVSVRVRVRREEDVDAVHERILKRLHATITPLAPSPGSAPAGTQSGAWPFGQSLSSYHVYRILSAEPGVLDVEPVVLNVDRVPATDVSSLAADWLQPDTWYAASGPALFRSINNAAGWEHLRDFDGEQITRIKPYASTTGGRRPGQLAVASKPQGAGSCLHLSSDCGDSWDVTIKTQFEIHDLAWLERDRVATLLLATDVGLYEIKAEPGAVPIQIVVDSNDQDLGFYAVAVSTDVFGETTVAVAARSQAGVYLSPDAGKPNSYSHIGLRNELIRLLHVQHSGPHRFLWAGHQAIGDDPGTGASRWDIRGGVDSPGGWQHFNDNWAAGGCMDLDFAGDTVFAATSRMGIVQLDLAEQQPRWRSPDVACGLPLREFEHGGQTNIVMEKVDCLAVRDDVDGALPIVLAGGRRGIFQTHDGGTAFTEASRQSFGDLVTLPTHWLFCSSDHEVEVISDA